MGTQDERPTCSFCHLPNSPTRPLVRGSDEDPHAIICGTCAYLALEEIRRSGRAARRSGTRLLTPKEIKAELDEWVVGQDDAKRALSVAVYQHYQRVRHNTQAEPGADEVELTKSNVLLVGPTGSGKTLLAETLSRILDVPFAIYDTTSLTEAGFVGEDVENVLLRLLQNADGNIDRAQQGIIYLDEIDKTGRKSPSASITRDPSGEGVQQALLKIIEGTVANVPKQGGRKHPGAETVQLNTRDILFIAGGTFDGIDRIHARNERQSTIGFVRAEHDAVVPMRSRLVPQDLIDFGMIPELVGRLPRIVALEPLREEDLVAILEEPRNALLQQYAARLAFDDALLVVLPEAKRAIARIALERGLGARGLRAIVEDVLEPVLFEVPGSGRSVQIVVDEDVVLGRRPAVIRERALQQDPERSQDAAA